MIFIIRPSYYIGLYQVSIIIQWVEEKLWEWWIWLVLDCPHHKKYLNMFIGKFPCCNAKKKKKIYHQWYTNSNIATATKSPLISYNWLLSILTSIADLRISSDLHLSATSNKSNFEIRNLIMPYTFSYCESVGVSISTDENYHLIFSNKILV